MPNIGEVMYVRTSEEPVCVLGTRKIRPEELGKKFPETYNGTGDVIVVRRPVMTDATGITYQLWDFLSEELETEDEQSKRLFNKIMSRQKLTSQEMGLDLPFNKPVKPS